MQHFIDGSDGQIRQNPGPSSLAPAVGDIILENSMTEADSSVATSLGSTGSNRGQPSKRQTLPKRVNVPISLKNVTVIQGVDGAPVKYQCKYCDKSFKTKSHIKYHDFCNFTPTDRLQLLPFKCEQCEQGFIAKSHYDYHRQVHSGLRPFQCTLCKRTYSHKNKLIRHMKSHSPEKFYHCDKCQKKFSSSQNLKVHQLTHTSLENSVYCNICGKAFRAQVNLRKHLLRHSGAAEGKLFACSICDLKFKFEWTKVNHEQTHSLEKPHVCTQCWKAFKSKKDFRRHLVTHSGLRPYACLLCFSQFRRSDNLGRHIRSAHKLPESLVKALLVQTSPAILASLMSCCGETSADGSELPGPSTSAAASTSTQSVQLEAELQALIQLRKKAYTIIEYRRDNDNDTEVAQVPARKPPKKNKLKTTRLIPSTIVRPDEDEEIVPELAFQHETIEFQEQEEENKEMKPDVTALEQAGESLKYSVFEAAEFKMAIKVEEQEDICLPEFGTEQACPTSGADSIYQYNYTVKEEYGSNAQDHIMSQTISVYSTPTEINYTVKEEKIESQTEREFVAENLSLAGRGRNRFLSQAKSGRYWDWDSLNESSSSSANQFYMDLAREWGMAPLSLAMVKAEPAEPNEEIPDACCVVEVE